MPVVVEVLLRSEAEGGNNYVDEELRGNNYVDEEAELLLGGETFISYSFLGGLMLQPYFEESRSIKTKRNELEFIEENRFLYPLKCSCY